jgi:hypothetical protein
MPNRAAAAAAINELQNQFARMGHNPDDRAQRQAAAGMGSVAILSARLDELERALEAAQRAPIYEPGRE